MQVLLVSECFWPFFHQEREPCLLGVLVLHPAQSKCRFLSNWSLLLWVLPLLQVVVWQAYILP